MPKTWTEVEQSPEYINLDPQAKQDAKQQYFDSIVRQNPAFKELGAEQQAEATGQFFGSGGNTVQKQPSLIKKAAGAVFEPLAKTLTGKSIQDRAIDAVNKDNKYDGQSMTAPFDQNVNKVVAPTFLRTAAAGMAGSTADMATTPANYIPIPGARFLGKIPVGSTNLGRIASNVAVGPGFKKGVMELQRMESKLGNTATSASGKAIDTSSRGILPKDYHIGADKAILNVYNQAVNPSTGKYSSKSKLDGYQGKVLSVIKDIHSNQDQLKFENPMTDVIETRAPKDRSELLDASTQRQQQIFNQYTSLAKDSNVTIDKGKIAKDSFREIIKSPQYKAYDPNLVEIAKATKKRLSKQKAATPEQVQKDLEYLNKKMKGYYEKGDYNASNIYANYAGNLRQALNDAVEKAIGNGGYKDLKSAYGAHATLQKDLSRAAARQLKQSGKIATDHFSTPIAVAEFARGIMTHNPVDLAISAAVKGNQLKNRFKSNPDRRINGMFNFMDRAVKGPAKPINPPIFAPRQQQAPMLRPPQPEMDAVGAGKLFAQPMVSKEPAPTDVNAMGRIMDEGGPAPKYHSEVMRVHQSRPAPHALPPAGSPDPNGFLKESKSRMMGNRGSTGKTSKPVGWVDKKNDPLTMAERKEAAKGIKQVRKMPHALPDSADDSTKLLAGTAATGTAIAAGLGAGKANAGQKKGKKMTTDITNEDAVKAIIGEAEGEGIDGMRAVASAIRNRGTLKGVYGLKAPRVVGNKYSPEVLTLAKQAWKESQTKDYSNGATHWEGTKFKTPAWAKDMEEALTVGNQRFYRQKRKA